MIKRSGSLAYRKDANGRVIPSVTSIRDITNTTIEDDSWTAISMPSDINCKSILVLTRDDTVWKLSHLAAGTRYATIRTAFIMDIAGISSEVLFYAQSVSGDKTLEVLFLD